MNTFCCIRLPTGVKVIAVLTAVWALFSFSVRLLDTYTLDPDIRGDDSEENSRQLYHSSETSLEEEDDWEQKTDLEKLLAEVTHLIIMGYVILGSYYLVLSYILYTGASQENIERCRVWLYHMVAFSLFDIIKFLISIPGGLDESEVILQAVSTSFDIFSLLVVYSYINELLKSPPLPK